MSEIADTAQAVERVNQALQPLGFVRASAGHRWQREAEGRSWKVSLTPQRRTRYLGEVRVTNIQGFRLRIDLTTTAKVRAYAVRKGIAESGMMRRFYRWRRFEHVPLSSAGADGFEMVTSDAGWVQRLLADPPAARAFTALAEYREGAGESASVYFEPDELHYASPLLDADEVQSPRLIEPVEHLTILAHAADRVPPPDHPATLNALERVLRQHPYIAAIGFIMGTMALLAGGAVALILIAWLISR